jgi:hypothetical protein
MSTLSVVAVVVVVVVAGWCCWLVGRLKKGKKE